MFPKDEKAPKTTSTYRQYERRSWATTSLTWKKLLYGSSCPSPMSSSPGRAKGSVASTCEEPVSRQRRKSGVRALTSRKDDED